MMRLAVLLSAVSATSARSRSSVRRVPTLAFSSVCGPTSAALDLMERLGFDLLDSDLGSITYNTAYVPPPMAVSSLTCIPHGRTPSNEKLLFQSHAEGPDGILLPESFEGAQAGAKVYFDRWGDQIRGSPSRFVFLRSPLERTAQTAGVYREVGESMGITLPEIDIEPRVIEINHGNLDPNPTPTSYPRPPPRTESNPTPSASTNPGPNPALLVGGARRAVS